MRMFVEQVTGDGCHELGGDYLKPDSELKLRSMFLGIRNELEAIFHSHKEALKLLLKEAQFNPYDTAIVDIGWNASSVRCLSRLGRAMGVASRTLRRMLLVTEPSASR